MVNSESESKGVHLLHLIAFCLGLTNKVIQKYILEVLNINVHTLSIGNTSYNTIVCK